MRVLFVNSSYPNIRCGIGDYTYRLAEEMGRTGRHRVTVITSATPLVPASRNNVRVKPILPEWGLRQFYTSYLAFLKEWPSVVVVQYPSVMLGERSELTFELPRLVRVFLPWAKVIFIVHEFARTHESARRMLLERSLPFSHRIWLVDALDEQQILSIDPRLGTKTRLLDPPTGPNIPFNRIEETHLLRLRSQVAKEGQSIVFFFGFLNSEEKGFEDLLAALSRLQGHDIVLVATGELSGSPYHQGVSALLRESGMEPKVHWLGFLPEEMISRWLQAADLVALPFRSGASASRTTLIASLVNGAATITTTSPGLPSFLEDRRNVLLVPPGDVAALASVIEDTLSSPRLIDEVRRGAKELEPRFAWSSIASQLLDSVKAS